MMPSLKKRDRQTKGKLLCCRRRRRRAPPLCAVATTPPPAANMAEREMYINEKLAVCLLYVVSKEKVESYAGRQQMELMGSCNETLHHSPKQS